MELLKVMAEENKLSDQIKLLSEKRKAKKFKAKAQDAK
jgi:hypothetical protein